MPYVSYVPVNPRAIQQYFFASADWADAVANANTTFNVLGNNGWAFTSVEIEEINGLLFIYTLVYKNDWDALPSMAEKGSIAMLTNADLSALSAAIQATVSEAPANKRAKRIYYFFNGGNYVGMVVFTEFLQYVEALP